ncbi:probable aminoacyl tRNA synthase complex-interacting multifunctional protein 2 isoform X1 [Neodiprion fabricii]|uniref:probable aminoacyl tRNA synthase complex-interacting multifunctional protein 2 isoform X1 n=1 Tax=Neodiprion fabricii TaxID=2872261 RepID=UPI001ED97F25|nr:probable aminoacyl tRNA synthase complex-interacting multifunctional protein 2 isoform X1 [Neodiprion fabricii]
MSCGTTMYALKPIVLMPGEVYEPKSVYIMKNINEVQQKLSDRTSHESSKIVSDITEQVIKFLKNPLPEIVELELRQEKILSQLAELKKQVSSLYGILKNSRPSNTTHVIAPRSKEKVRTDLVVNVNPTKPPFSLLALQNIWNDTDIYVSCHTHSTSTSPVPEFPLTAQNFNSENHTVEVSLIWKEISDLEVIISGVRGTRLLGEVSLLRYLSRLIASHNYESRECGIDASKIDSLLDLCHELSFQKSRMHANSVFATLAGNVGNGQWLLSRSSPSIADVAAWSAIKQLDDPNLPGNLTSWFKRCDNVFWRK